MRFDRLNIPAFGPFTNLDLKFTAQGGDLHVIYGSNEAGKSSLLRAFRDLLFGIHGQSSDNFVHDYKKLRIMGEIVNRGGERLTFQRRKGNKNTLLDAAGNELTDNALVPFLGSVDQEYFSAMFGLGSKELREGAEQLLCGKGDIGNALFSASMGGTPVQLVLAALTEESDRLFKGRSTANVSIRPAANKYKELLRQSRDAIVSPETWDKIERELADAETSKKKLEDEIADITIDLEWITRCEDALPTVGRLCEELRKLEALPPLPDVSSDFVERARAARKETAEAHAEVNRLTIHIAKLGEQLADCQTAPELLADADGIDILHQDLGAYRVRKNTLTDLETELAALEATLRAGMQNLELTGSFSELEKLRQSSAVRLACEEAATDLQKALDERDKNREKMDDSKTQIKSLEAQLLALPESDLTSLRDALSVAAGAIEANKTLLACEMEVKRLSNETSDRHQMLNGAPACLDTTATLPIPTKATIRRFAEAMDEISREISSEESKIVEGEKRIEALQAELGRLERRGELPSEQTLFKAREHRDHGWKLVLAEWKGSGTAEELLPGTPLEEAFPQTVAKADGIADQLREQAEAVAQAEEKRYQVTLTEKKNQDAAGNIEKLQARLKESQASWEAAWLPCGITPQSPAEMEEWRETWSEFKDRLRLLRVAEETFSQKSTQVLDAKLQLATVLSESAEKEFAFLFDEARRRVQKGEQTSGRRIELTNLLNGLKSPLEIFEQNDTRYTAAVDAETITWENQALTVGLPKNISPKSGLALLQERKELLSNFDSWKAASAKLQRTAEAVRIYEQSVREKAAVFGVKGDTTETQETDLWNELTKARVTQTLHDQLLGQIKDEQEALEEMQAAYNRSIAALNELLLLAKLETVEELEPLLANLELRDQAQSQIATFRDTLSGLARGQAVDDFLERIREEDIEELPQRKRTLQNRKEENEEALQKVRDTLFELKGQSQTLEAAGDAAANYRQQAESYAARLKQDAARFVRLRLAANFLQTQIERFRKENQAPLLEKSGQVFSSITRGAYGGLGAEFNADDVPVLVGLRPDQTTVPISGMSDGARDQLYIALRLAALDRYLENHEPMPLILDDLLITFDDERCEAILPQLASLAQRTQIFLFTHHDHLVGLCRKTLAEGSYHLHQLNTRSGAKGN